MDDPNKDAYGEHDELLSDRDLAELDRLQITHPKLWRYIRECGQSVLILQQEVMRLSGKPTDA
jgi:hypothetical protein